MGATGLRGRLGCARDSATRVHEKILGSVSRQDFRVVTGLGLGLGDQGRDKGALCRDKGPLAVGSRPWTVSRPGLDKAERPCVATWKRCHDRGPILLCCDKEFSIAIENLRRSVTIENLLSRQGRPFGVAT